LAWNRTFSFDVAEDMENEFLKATPARKRKALGQFFTPDLIASEMARWVTRDYRSSSLLDAGVGTGVFVKSFLRGRRQAGVRTPVSIDCIDIDRDVLDVARRGVIPEGNEEVRFIEGDFLAFAPDKRYDAIISNPPYYKHHFIENKSQAVASIKKMTGCDLPVTINVYCLFLFRARALMASPARCAFIIPGEFLNADYGVSVKRHLLDDPAFKGIISFSFDRPVFDDAVTTACIVLFETGPPASDDVLLASLGDASSVSGAFRLFNDRCAAVEPAIKATRFARDSLDPHRKWQNYLTLKVIDAKGPHLVPLAKYASCSRGMATGANDYFTLSESKRRAHSIPLEDLLPCVTKSSDAPGPVFTRDDHLALSRTGSRVYLLNPRLPLYDTTSDYIAEGVRQGIDLRYLPSHRDTWFLPERQTPAPVWVQVFSRQRTRFVWNRSGVNHLTTFHGIYPNDLGRDFFPALLVYLWSDACQRRMQEHQRQYGNGLKKYEPRDIERILVPDFERCDPAWLGKAQRVMDSVGRGEQSDNIFDD
jgi:adenine-specific DNA-methyltransferase